MKSTYYAPLMVAGLSLALVAACTDDTATDLEEPPVAATEPALDPADDMTAPGVMDDPMADPMAMPGDAAMQPAEVLGLVAAVDRHEIAAAEQAREKAVEGELMEYADMLHEDHTANLEATTEAADTLGVELATGGMVAEHEEKGQATLDRLASLEGEAYADAWIDAMVQGHTDALGLIDDQLMPAAADPALEDHLTMTRETIAQHLTRAEELQGNRE